MKIKEVNVRDLQHNLSHYINMAKSDPISIQKYGKQEVIMVNPQQYEIKKKKIPIHMIQKAIDVSGFIGMYKDRTDWESKSSTQVAKELRRGAWYGQ